MRRYEGRLNDEWYARVGLLMFIETLLMPFLFPALVLLFKSL